MGTSTYPARQAEPGQRFNTRDDEQGEIELAAGEDGIVQPQTLAEHRAAELFQIPLAAGHEAYAGPLYTHPADPEEMTKTELVAVARGRGVSAAGTKAEIAARLSDAETTGGEA